MCFWTHRLGHSKEPRTTAFSIFLLNIQYQLRFISTLHCDVAQVSRRKNDPMGVCSLSCPSSLHVGLVMPSRNARSHDTPRRRLSHQGREAGGRGGTQPVSETRDKWQAVCHAHLSGLAAKSSRTTCRGLHPDRPQSALHTSGKCSLLAQRCGDFPLLNNSWPFFNQLILLP